MSILLKELKELVLIPFPEFKSSFKNIRSAERNFQHIYPYDSGISGK